MYKVSLCSSKRAVQTQNDPSKYQISSGTVMQGLSTELLGSGWYSYAKENLLKCTRCGLMDMQVMQLRTHDFPRTLTSLMSSWAKACPIPELQPVTTEGASVFADVSDKESVLPAVGMISDFGSRLLCLSFCYLGK